MAKKPKKRWDPERLNPVLGKLGVKREGDPDPHAVPADTDNAPESEGEPEVKKRLKWLKLPNEVVLCFYSSLIPLGAVAIASVVFVQKESTTVLWIVGAGFVLACIIIAFISTMIQKSIATGQHPVVKAWIERQKRRDTYLYDLANAALKSLEEESPTENGNGPNGGQRPATDPNANIPATVGGTATI